MNEFQQVGQHLKIGVDVPAEAVRKARSARAQVGLLGSCSSDRMIMTIGKDTYQLASGTYFQEVKLRRVPAVGRVTLDFCLLHREGTLGERPAEDQPQNRLRVSSVSIVTEQ